MCGRFVAATDADGLARFFVVDERRDEGLEPSWNVAPTQRVPTVVEHEGVRALTAFRWGLVPHWADDPRIGNKMINARAETAARKPAFRDAVRRRRCLIPADGFYEWQQRADGSKVPHFVHRRDGDPMAFAGLWAVWREPEAPEDAEPLRTCTIVTTEAGPDLAALHERQPVVLEPGAWGAWLDRGVREAEQVQDLLGPSAPGTLTAYPVSREVNTPRTNHPRLLERVEADPETGGEPGGDARGEGDQQS